MGKENKLLVAVKTNNLTSVIKVFEKYSKDKYAKNRNKKLDFTCKDNYGLCSMHHAARNGNKPVLELLIKNGANVDIYDKHGLRAISYACAEGYAVIVECLIRHNSCVNRVSPEEYLTPIHLASMYGYSDIVHLLVVYGADYSIVNREGRTSLDLAYIYGKYNVVNLLLSYKKTREISKSMDCYVNLPCDMDKMTIYDDRSNRGPSTASFGSNGAISTGSLSSCASGSVNKSVLIDSDRTLSSNHSSNVAEIIDCLELPKLHYNIGNESEIFHNDLRQNLREACFGVQSRAVQSFSGKSLICLLSNATKSNQSPSIRLNPLISFAIGDLITILKQFHNGLAKGFVTSEGLHHTGLFPVDHVEYICQSPAKVPRCCSQPLQTYPLDQLVSMLQMEHKDQSSPPPQDDSDDISIEMPPQMTPLVHSSSAMPPPHHQHHKNSLNNAMSPGNTAPNSSSSASSTASTNQNNKRSSMASLDSGRGSASDTKSVISGPSVHNGSSQHSNGCNMIGPQYSNGCNTIGPQHSNGCNTIGPQHSNGCNTIGPQHSNGCNTIGPQHSNGCNLIGPQHSVDCNTIGPQHSNQCGYYGNSSNIHHVPLPYPIYHQLESSSMGGGRAYLSDYQPGLTGHPPSLLHHHGAAEVGDGEEEEEDDDDEDASVSSYPLRGGRHGDSDDDDSDDDDDGKSTDSESSSSESAALATMTTAGHLYESSCLPHNHASASLLVEGTTTTTTTQNLDYTTRCCNHANSIVPCHIGEPQYHYSDTVKLRRPPINPSPANYQ